MSWPLVSFCILSYSNVLTGHGVVLNPVVKFLHIKKHWDAEYVDQATEWGQDEASYTLSSTQLLMHCCLQLEKYCRCRVPGGSSPPPLAWTVVGPSVLAEYGITTSEDEDDTPQTQTVTDEVATYLNSPRATRGTDTLKFWSVSDLMLILSSLLTLHLVQWSHLSYMVPRCTRLPANTSLLCAFQMHLLIKC